MYALRAGHLFDGHTEHGPSVVLVDDGTIAEVRPYDHPIPEGVEVGDLGAEATLLPGLIDTHVHLVFDCTMSAVDNLANLPDEALLADMRVRARTALTAGVTTMRDLGDRRYLSLRLRDELARQLDAGPQLLVAGPPITSLKGHCWFLGGEVDCGSGNGHAEAALRTAVQERVARGVDAIKVMATGGELTPGTQPHLPQFTAAQLRVIVDEAHRHGLPVAAHAHGSPGITNALAAGVDSIEHCTFMDEHGVAPDSALTRALAESETIVSFTVGVAPTDIAPPPRIAALLPAIFDNVRDVLAAGVTVTVGSDAGIGPPKPHDVLPYGAAALVDLGLTPAEALTALTATAARSCGVADRKGALRPGFDADLLVVRGNPLADIRALHHVLAVYRAGVRVAGARTSPPAAPLSELVAKLIEQSAQGPAPHSEQERFRRLPRPVSPHHLVEEVAPPRPPEPFIPDDSDIRWGG